METRSVQASKKRIRAKEVEVAVIPAVEKARRVQSKRVQASKKRKRAKEGERHSPPPRKQRERRVQEDEHALQASRTLRTRSPDEESYGVQEDEHALQVPRTFRTRSPDEESFGASPEYYRDDYQRLSSLTTKNKFESGGVLAKDILEYFERHISSNPNSIHLNDLAQAAAEIGFLNYKVLEHINILYKNETHGRKCRYLILHMSKSMTRNRSVVHDLLQVLQHPRIVSERTFDHLRTYLHKTINSSEFANARPDNVLLSVEGHLSFLFSHLSNYSYKWKDIGRCLLPSHALQNIEHRCLNDSSSCLYEVLNRWLLTEPSPTLKLLQGALASEAVGLGRYAVDLERSMMITFLENQCDSNLSDEENDLPELVLSGCIDQIDLQDSAVAVLLEVNVKNKYSDSTRLQWYRDEMLLQGESNYILCIVVKDITAESTYRCMIDERLKSNSISISVRTPIDEYKMFLIEKYDSEPEVIPDTWPDVEQSTYINLAILSGREIKTECSFTRQPIQGDFDDVLLDKSSTDYKSALMSIEHSSRILVVGRPGSGKTTLVHRISQDWAKNIIEWKSVRLLFLVHLRGFRSNPSIGLKEIVGQYFKDYLALEIICNYAEKHHGLGYCFILDGLDEYQPCDNETFIFRLINKDLLPKAVVIVSSRPAAVAMYRKTATKEIEVLGFFKREIEKYIFSYRFSSKSSNSNLIKYLNQHPNVHHMCYLPIQSAMICFLFEAHGGLPSTETKIYEEFTKHAILRTIYRYKSSSESVYLKSIHSLKGPEKVTFHKICQLAFEKTRSSLQILEQTEVDQLCETLELEDTLGLITVDFKATESGFQNIYTFCHLTFQEFLAACHILFQEQTEQMEIIKSCGPMDHMQVVFKFFCGLVKFDEDCGLFTKLLACSNFKPLFRVQCAFETQQSQVCDYVARPFLQFKDLFMTSSDFTAIGYVIAHVNQNIVKWVSFDCSPSEECMEAFDKALEGHSASLKILEFRGCAKGHLQAVVRLITVLPSLEVLSIADTEQDVNDIDSISSILRHHELKILKFCCESGEDKHKPLPTDQLQKLGKTFTSNCSSLRNICFSASNKNFAYTTFNKNLPFFFFSILSETKAHYTDCDFSNSELKALSVDLMCGSICTELSLINCNINDEKAALLAEALKTKCFLKILILTANKIGDKGAIAIAECLPQSEIQHVDLSLNQICDGGASALLEATSMKDISLSLFGNNVSFQTASKDVEQKMMRYNFEIPIYSATMTDELLKYHLPKNKINGVDYESYCNKIKFILLTGSDHEFNAAATYLHNPSIEGHVHDAKDTATSLQPNIVIGTFAGGPIALIQTSKEKSMNNFFETVIGIFPDANYIISTGTSFAVQQKEMKLGDVFISSGITVIDDYSVNIDDSMAYIHIQGSHMNTIDFLQTLFCFDSSVPKIFKVTEFRAADYQISNIISGIDLSEDSRLYNKTSIIVDLNAVGGDVNGRELMQLQNEGKIKGFIVIKSVTEYIDSRKNHIWKFTGAMAAVHYVEQKMMPYNYHVTSVDQYMSALESGDVVNVMVAKLIFLGPPMQGKTVTRQRLTKAIKNISSSDVDKSNTGVSEQTTVIICKDMLSATALAIDDDEWTTVDVGEEKLFCLNVSQTEFEDTSHSEYVEAEQVTQHSSNSQQVKERFIPEEPNQSPNFSSTGCVQSEHSRSQASFGKKDNTRPTSAEISAVSLEWSKKIPGILTKRKIYNLEHLKKKLDKGYLLYMQDTGGQPELMECLPVLTIGPALYFLFCKLTSRLDETYKIGYRGPDGTTLPIQSHFTMKETLLSALASVASMGYSSTDQDTDIQQQVTNREGCVYLIGTHRDEVKTIEAINHFESELRKVLESTFFYEKDLIKWWNEEDMPPESGLFSKDIDARLVYPLDNMFGENKEMKCLRSSIHKRLNKLFANQKIPTNWLVFGICLRQKEEGTVTLESCFELGLELNMSKDVTRAALHFLHYNLGICMHFSNIPALKDLVIPNTQSIYKSLTTLIESAFKPSKVVPRATSLFKKTGRFSIEKFKEISDFSLPLKTLVDILEHLNIIARISSDDSEEPMFFMPCILQNASDDEIAIFERENPISQVLSPLFIRYDCGFVPLGVFSSMVANLMQQASQKKAHTGIALKLKPDNLKRNHVQFWNGCDIITFIHKPEYIRIHTSQQKECDEKLYEVCPKIRNLVKNTLGSITESMLNPLYTATSEERYKFHFQTYQFAFKCYEHSEHDHLCVVSNEEMPETMNCVWDGNNTPLVMRAENLIWYGKKLSPSKLPASEDMPVWNVQLREMQCLNLIRYYDPNTSEKKELRILDDLSADWEDIGVILGFRPQEIKAIQNAGAGRTLIQCLREVISKWMQNADKMPSSKRYPWNWTGFYNMLEDSKHGATANDLKAAINSSFSDLHQNFDAVTDHGNTQTLSDNPEPVMSQKKQSPSEHPSHKPCQHSQETTPQTKSKERRKKLNKVQLAEWLEEQGVDVEDINILKSEGVNELLFLKMKAEDSRTTKLSEATVEQLLDLQDELRNY